MPRKAKTSSPPATQNAAPLGFEAELFKAADTMQRLSAEWREQQLDAARLDAAIKANLRALGF